MSSDRFATARADDGPSGRSGITEAPDGQPEPSSLGAAEAPALLNTRILVPLANYLRDKHGTEGFESACTPAGLDASHFDGRTHWAPVENCEHFLQRARDIVGSEESLKRACGYRITESLGPLGFLLRAASPGAVLEKAISNLDMISTFSSAEITERSPRQLRLSYRSRYKEGRELCLSRQGSTSQFPTIWGLPPAVFTEHACIAKGDETCEYQIEWRQHRRWWPQLLGLGLGVLAAAATATTSTAALAWLLIPLAGWALGFAYEINHAHAANTRAFADSQDALLQLSRDEAEARKELQALHDRQSEWMKLFEEQAASRSRSLEKVVDQLKSVQSKQIVALRGVTHDLRNPLAILAMMPDLLDGHANRAELFELHRQAVQQIEAMLGELLARARVEAIPTRGPSRVEVSDLLERTRRTLRALAYGKAITTTVVATRDAPDQLEVDKLRLDRVVDNLLTNAVKYTAGGSITVELGGAPGYLTLRISDTGRGISSEKIERVFEPGGSDADVRAPGSLGIGLSSVVNLLAEMGGRLEVMSKPGLGSTFHAQIPTAPASQPVGGSDVLRIRRADP